MSNNLEPFPKIDLDELERFRKQNQEERLKFVRMYAEWMKDHSNAEWSSQQKRIVNTFRKSKD